MENDNNTKQGEMNEDFQNMEMTRRREEGRRGEGRRRRRKRINRIFFKVDKGIARYPCLVYYYIY